MKNFAARLVGLPSTIVLLLVCVSALGDQGAGVIRAKRFELIGPQGLERGGWYVGEEGETVFEVRIKNALVRITAAAGGDAAIEVKNAGTKHACSAIVGVTERGGAFLKLSDGSGRERAAVRLDGKGGRFDLRDDRGILRATLGSIRSPKGWNQQLQLREKFGRPVVWFGAKDGEKNWMRISAPHRNFEALEKRPGLEIEARGETAPEFLAYGPGGELLKNLMRR